MVAWAGIEKLWLGISDPVELPVELPVPWPVEASSAAMDAATDAPRAPKRRTKAKDVRPRWPLGSELGPLE